MAVTRRLLGAWAAALGVAAAGCVSGPTALSGCDADTVARIAAVGAGDQPGVARAQKPDKAGPTGGLPALPREPSSDAARGEAAARIAATVNGEAILSEEVAAVAYQGILMTRGLSEPERTSKMREVTAAALNELIEREVVLQDAFARLKAHGNEKQIAKLQEIAGKEFDKQWLKPMIENNGGKSKEEFAELLKTQGLSLEMVRRHWERKFMSAEYLRSMVYGRLDRIGHPEIEAYYRDHPDDFKVEDGVVWQDLFVNAGRHPDRAAARRYAESLAQRARNGDDFARLVEQFDDGDSKLRKGEGEGRKRGEIRPAEAEPVLFSLKEGEVGPLVELPGGFHVVRVAKRDLAGTRPFDEKVQKQIRDKLRGELAQREIRRLVNELKRKAIIDYAQ
jgi:peptidyl-prolyl cis-trans isomerase SurA